MLIAYDITSGRICVQRGLEAFATLYKVRLRKVPPANLTQAAFRARYIGRLDRLVKCTTCCAGRVGEAKKQMLTGILSNSVPFGTDAFKTTFFPFDASCTSSERSSCTKPPADVRYSRNACSSPGSLMIAKMVG